MVQAVQFEKEYTILDIISWNICFLLVGAYSREIRSCIVFVPSPPTARLTFSFAAHCPLHNAHCRYELLQAGAVSACYLPALDFISEAHCWFVRKLGDVCSQPDHWREPFVLLWQLSFISIVTPNNVNRQICSLPKIYPYCESYSLNIMELDVSEISW